MDIKSLMHADYLDIVFDNRNKNYGGYELRRHYGGRVGKAAGILYSALAAFVLFIVLRAPNDLTPVAQPIFDPISPREFRFTSIVPPKPAPPAPPQPKAQPNTPPVIARDPIPDPEPFVPSGGSPSTAGTGAGVESMDAGNGPDNTRGGKGNTQQPLMEPEKPHVYVEQMPRFDGDMNDYLSKNVHYPEVARETNIEGKVVIHFVVDEAGAVTNASVARGIGGGCDEEALRVVAAMPKWKPGRQNGIAVKVYFSVAVNFVLQ